MSNQFYGDNLIDMLEHVASKQPNQIAFTYLKSGDIDGEIILLTKNYLLKPKLLLLLYKLKHELQLAIGFHRC